MFSDISLYMTRLGHRMFWDFVSQSHSNLVVEWWLLFGIIWVKKTQHTEQPRVSLSGKQLFGRMDDKKQLMAAYEAQESLRYHPQSNDKGVGMKRCLLIGLTVILLTFAIFSLVFFGLRATNKAPGDFSKGEVRHHHDHHGRPPQVKDRPPYQEKAKMARYIVHQSQWGVLTTFCTHNKGFPWGEVVSVSDGLENESTGIPLIYISTMDVADHDLRINPKASFTFSEAENDWCRTHSVDPEDPRCARVHLFGQIVKLTAEEIPDAKKAMFTRHPIMQKWPESHNFYFAKINLTRVEVLDYFGPLSVVPVDDYLKAKP